MRNIYSQHRKYIFIELHFWIINVLFYLSHLIRINHTPAIYLNRMKRFFLMGKNSHTNKQFHFNYKPHFASVYHRRCYKIDAWIVHNIAALMMLHYSFWSHTYLNFFKNWVAPSTEFPIHSIFLIGIYARILILLKKL